MKLKGLHVSWPLIVAAVVTGLAAYGAYISRPRPVSSLPVTQAGRTQSHPAHPSARKPSTPATPSQVSYERAIRANMFNGPQPPDPKPAAPPVKPQRQIVIPQPPPDPLADAVYAGSATIDGRTTALIESRSTREGEYIFAGGNWHGFDIAEIASDHVSLRVNGANRTLMKSDEVNVVPLSATAAGSAPANGAAAGQPSPLPSGARQDPNASKLQMLMQYKSSMGAASKLLEMQKMEMDSKSVQDKVQSYQLKKL